MARRPPKKPAGAGRPWYYAFLSLGSFPEPSKAERDRAKRSIAARKGAETRKLNAAKKAEARERKTVSGLRKRARDVMLDILERMGRHDWAITTKRSSERAGAAIATAVGPPFYPGPPIPARYDRTVRALSIPKRGNILAREANVRVEHLTGRVDNKGKPIRMWETIVPLTADPHALILRFDAVWEETIQGGGVRHGVDYGGPVITVEVYFVEHRK